MTRFCHVGWLALAALWLGGCNSASTPPPARTVNPAPAREGLNRIVDRYWDERAPGGNPLSQQYLADSLAVERRFLAEIIAVPRAPLDADAKLTYDILKRQRERAIESLTYPAELMPVNPFDGMPLDLVRAALDTEQYPLKSAADYESWRVRIDDYARWTKQAIANMREGARRGYTSPRVLMRRMLPLLQSLGDDTSVNVFYAPLRPVPGTLKEAERASVSASFTRAVKDRLLPAYRELHDFIQHEYLPRARVSVGMSALPLGPSWYATLARIATGTQLTPAQIHGIGLAEVERIRASWLSVPAGAPRAGADDLLIAYHELKEQTVSAMPMLFSAMPRSDLQIRARAPPAATTALLDYRPAMPERGTPAVLYVQPRAGTAASHVNIASFLQEAIPGRHYQSALQQERTDLPKFRRFGTEPAFIGGWSLYAASVGEELGLYRDDEAKRDALAGQLTCAVALVVDTGLHAKDWTHAQAAAYLRAQLAVDDADADLMTDRFLAFPGDALACKMGELRFRALRARAQQALGTRFDIREFHSEILKDGAMPLDILEAKVKAWLEAQL